VHIGYLQISSRFQPAGMRQRAKPAGCAALGCAHTTRSGTAIAPDALAGTSPYLNEHLNRFGSYELGLIPNGSGRALA